MRDFNGAIVFRSILCPKNLTHVKKKCDLSGAAFRFSKTVNISSLICDCMKFGSPCG